MPIKVVVLFQDVTLVSAQAPNAWLQQNAVLAPGIGYQARPHIGGWSESFWWASDVVTDLINALQIGAGGAPGLLPSRAALLPNSSAIVGIRLYSGGAGKGQSYGFSYPGNPALSTDVPQMALLCKTGPVGTAVTRRFTIRGVPDAEVTTGEFTPDANYVTAIQAYFLALGNFAFYAIDPSSPQAKIAEISDAGVVKLVDPVNPFGVNQWVTIQKTLNAAGQFVTRRVQITAIGINPAQITVANWTDGPCTKGKAVVKQLFLYVCNPAVSRVSRVVVRKVGRPSELYRGRRSKRKVSA